MDAKRINYLQRLAPLLFIFFIFTARLTAQSPPMLELGIPTTGTITSGGIQEWTFTILENSMISLIVESDTFDPIVEVEDQSGDPIIANDDYNYPVTQDAIIEGFTIPETGAYTVRISEFGSSGGEYTVTMLTGYSEIYHQEDFSRGRIWVPVEGGQGETSVVSVGDQMNVEAEGRNAIGIIQSEIRPEGIFYAEVDIANVVSTNSEWKTGLVFRQQDEENFYLVSIHADGNWQFSVYEDGAETIVSNWQPHPAIAEFDTTFRLAVLVNQSTFEVFYDGQAVGTVRDNRFPEGGSIGLMVGSSTPTTTRTEITFERVLVTVPRKTNEGDGIFPQQIALDTGAIMIQGLWRRNFLNNNGVVVLNLPESDARDTRAGVNLYEISGRTFTNVAIGTTVTSPTRTDSNGCGLTVRGVDDEHYVLAFVDHQGSYGLSQNIDNAFTEGIYNENPDLREIATHHLLLIAYEDQVYYYLNGHFVGAIANEPTEGAIANAVVNFENISTSCFYSNTWIYSWD